MYNFVKGKRLFVKGSREEDDPDNVADPNEVDLVRDGTVERQHYNLENKNHMASASQESRELFKTSHNRNGLKTVHTQRVVKKTTSVNRGEQKKLPTYAMIDGDKLKEKLMKWARKSTKGYPRVNVTDFTKSWQDGLALNAIIHRNRPDLVNFHKCQESSARDNHQNAFTILEKNFGIPATIDPDRLARGKVDEDEMVKYLAQVYEVFPNPPDHNPLWDSENIRRIDEYKELASRLVVWLKESIPKLKDRNFPNILKEMIALKEENRHFRTEQIPPRLHDKQYLASLYEDVVNLARTLPGKHVKIEEDYNIANIERLWNKMITAHQERDHAIDEEIARLEKLERVAENLAKDIAACDQKLDELKHRIKVEMERVMEQDPLQHNYNIDNIRRDMNVEEDRIKNMYNVLKYLEENRYHKTRTLHNHVDHLANKLKNLKIDFEAVEKVLADRRAEALRKPKTEDELIRTDKNFKFLHDCIQWVRSKQQYLEGLDLGEDVPTIERGLDQFQREFVEIQRFQSDVEKCKSNKRNVDPENLPIYEDMLNRLLTGYDKLTNFAQKRITDLKSFLEFVKLAERELAWIANKEDIEVSRDWAAKNLKLDEISKYHGTVVKEMENREREFNSVQDMGEQLVRGRHPCSKVIEGMMAKMQFNWSWLLQLINCLEEHLKYTGDYHSFMEDVKELKKNINQIEDKLNNQYSRQHFSSTEGEKMHEELMALRSEIEKKIKARVENLEERAGTIVNMKQRKAPLPRPTQVRSLCMIKTEHGTIHKNETVTLFDNSQRNKWKIRAQNGAELSIPSACFVIPPPDPDVLQALAELKLKLEDLIGLWSQKYRELRQNNILASLKTLNNMDYPTYCATDPEKIQSILRSLEDDINKLARESPADDPMIKRLHDELSAVKKKFADFDERKQREAEEKKNQELIQKFINSVNDLLEKLQEKERILQQRAQAPIPRETSALEQMISEHNEFQHDLIKFESKIKALKEEFFNIPTKSHAAQSKYEAIIETWERLCSLSKSYSDRLTALKVVLKDIETASSLLSEMQSKLAQYHEVPADEIDLKRMVTELVDLNAKCQENNRSFESLLSNVSKVRRLVERTRPKQTTHNDLNRLEEDVKSIYKKWNLGFAHIGERLSGLELCKELLRKYRGMMDNEKGWLSQTSAKVQTVLARSDLDQLSRMYEQIVQRKPSIEDTNVSGTRFINEAKNLNMKIKTYRENVEEKSDVSAKRVRFEGVELVEKELETLNSEYKALLDKVLSHLNKLQDDETRLKEFNQIADKLRTWLETKEKHISVLGPIGSEPYIVNTQLKQINVLKDEFSSQEHLLQKMDKLGESILERMDRASPNYKPIQNKMSDIHKTWQQLLAILEEREKNLLAVNEAAADFHKKLQKLQSNLDNISNEFDRITTSGLDNDEQLLKITNLEENLEAQRPLLAECGNACNYLCNLLTDNASKNEIKEKFKNVENRYNELCRKVANKKSELLATLKEDREFFMSCNDLQEWLRNMLNLLSTDIRISAILEKVIQQIREFEPVYREVMDKEHEVHMVLNRGNNILNKSSNRADAANWRQTLDNIKRQWDLVKKETLDKNAKLHKCHDVCRKYNNAFNEFYPMLKQYENKIHQFKDIALTKPELERQFREIQFLKNDISKHHQDYDNLRNLADSLLSIADTDKEHVHDQMNEVKNLWDMINAEVLKKYEQIDSILHKFTLYKDSLRDFVHNLQRLEDKVHAHETFGDQKLLDRMKNLLEEARAMRPHLDTIKNLAQELINEVQNDATSMPIRNEVRDVEERYNKLLDKLEEKVKAIDSYSAIIQNFNMQLQEIQNELNRLENVLNNMEPIARSQNGLRSQLDDIRDFRNQLKNVGKQLKDAEDLYRELKSQNYNIDSSVNKFQLDNLNRQYARLDDASKQRENGILSMMDKLKDFDGDLEGVDKQLGDATREFDRMKPISRDLDQIRQQQNEFKDFLNSHIDPLGRKIEDLKRKGNQLIQSAGPGVDTSKLEADIGNIANKWNDLKEKINERGRKLDVAMMQAGRFQDALEAFEKWLRETEDMMTHQKPPSSDYKEVKAQIQEQQFIKKMLNDREGSLRSLFDMGKEFMKNLDNNEKYQIENQLDDLSRRFDILKQKSDERLALLEQILPYAKAFLDKCGPLQEWLGSSERKLNLLKHSVAVDQESIRNKLMEHKNLHEDILNHKPQFEELTEIAQQLMSLVSDDEAQVVVDKTKELTDRYAKLVEDSSNFGDALNESNEILRNFILNFEDLFEWIDKMEQRISKHRVASTSVDKIREQLADLTDANQEIQANDRRVQEVIQLGQNFMRNMSGQDSVFIKQKSDQLQFKFADLKNKAAEYLKNMREVLPIAEKFFGAHDKLNAWFEIAERNLKNLESLTLRQQEETIHDLERQIPENRSLLEIVNNTGPQYCQYTPGQGTATIEGIVIKDNRRFNNIVEQINRQVDKIDAWKQQNDEVVHDIDELYEWFKDAERQLLEAEGIPHEPQRISVLLKETKALYDDINAQKSRVRDVLLNVKKLVRNSNNEDMIYIREKSEELKDLANRVSQLCLDRLNLLEQALPLAEHFFEAFNELSHWLNDAENEARMMNNASVPLNRMQEMINRLNRAISEHKPLVDRLNKTGQQLINIVQDKDGKQVKRMMDDINDRYNNLKVAMRDAQIALDNALQETAQFSDKMDGMLKHLANLLDQLKNAEPISAHPEKIQSQIYDNNAILDDLEKRSGPYETLCNNAREMIAKAGPNEPASRDIKSKLDKLVDNWGQCNKLAGARKNALDDALRLATKFWEQLRDCLKSLKEIEYTLSKEEPPAVEPNAIFHQQEQLQEIRRELDQTKAKMDECKNTGRDLMRVCADNEKHDVKKNLDDLDSLWKNVNTLFDKREKLLKDAMDRAVKFQDALQKLLEFLDASEETFGSFGPIAADLSAVKSQLNELNNFKRHVDSHIKDVENFNRMANDLLEWVSSSQAKSIREPQNEVNHRWDDLQKAIANRQAELENALLKLGQFEQSLNDFLEWMRKTERTLDEIKPALADPQVLEVELAKFRVLHNDIRAHQSNVDQLNAAGKMLIEAERGSENARNTQNKLNNLNSKWQQLLDKADQRGRELEELLKEAQTLNQELLDVIAWINDMDAEVSVSKPVGGLPETAKEQLARFMEFYNEIDSNRVRVDSLCDRGNDLLKRAREAPIMGGNLKTLKAKWEALLAKANEKKIKLEIALAEAIDFHNALENFMQWLADAEKYLDNLQPVSRVLERIMEQNEEHQKFQKECGDKREVMLELDKKGTQLKYFSQKQDVILIKNLLVNVQNRWEKVLSKSAERARALDYGMRETKAFYDAWTDLMNWLDELEKNFDSMQLQGNNPELIRQMIQKHREFQRQLGAKHQAYDNTLKMGKQLKDKAPKIDIPVLQKMLDELKAKWNNICNKSVDRQRKLEEALLFSGQFKDAIDALMDWLEKAKNQLLMTQSVYGDLDTVIALREEHDNFEDEFKRREKNLQSVYRISEELLKSAEPEDAANIKAEISSLNELWKEVEQLSHERTNELEKARIEAEKLHKAVHLLLEWLSDAEMKLRFSGPLPEDETNTREQMGEHETFIREMEHKEKDKEGTLEIAQSILKKCHVEATPVIKHWIVIITSRWEEVNSWAKQREARLNDHLKSLLDIMDSLEKLIAEFICTEAVILACETQALPDDNVELQKLIEEHVVCVDELEKRGLEVDKIVSTFAIKKQALANLKNKEDRKRGGLPRTSTPTRSQSDLTFDSVKHPKVKELTDKHKKVSGLAQERMKRLQDKLNYNSEVERVRNFDFDNWRRRFLDWQSNKKARIMDFFKRIDTNNDGRVTKAEFVEGFVASKFETSRLEMNKVVEIFDHNHDGYVDQREYMDTLRSDHMPRTESEIIQDEVQRQADQCTCNDRYKVSQVGECKYRFGESQKLRLVRILRSTVMVRVGGGWVSLVEFLHKHDPCRLKGRTNIELRETLSDFEGSKTDLKVLNEDGTYSTVGPITKIKEKTERSMPMHASSDFSFSDQSVDQSGLKSSRPLSRVTASGPGSRHTSQPPSRAASDLSIDSVDSTPRAGTSSYMTKSSSTKRLSSSRPGSISNLRDSFK